MMEMRYGGNIFLLPTGSSEAAVVTTNGIRRSNGRAVMGAGIAKYVRDSMPGSDLILGEHIRRNGNRACLLGQLQDPHRSAKNLDPWVQIMAMPTKHDWRDASDLGLIKKSACEMLELADENDLSKIYLPAPGCANGRLDYSAQVRPVIASILGQLPHD